MESKLKEIFNFLTTVFSWTQDIQINTICADKFELRSQSSVLAGGHDISMQGTFRLLLQPPVVWPVPGEPAVSLPPQGSHTPLHIRRSYFPP